MGPVEIVFYTKDSDCVYVWFVLVLWRIFKILYVGDSHMYGCACMYVVCLHYYKRYVQLRLVVYLLESKLFDTKYVDVFSGRLFFLYSN